MPDDIYLASIESNARRLDVKHGSTISFDVTITNLSGSEWKCASPSTLHQEGSGIRVGVLAQDSTGRTLCDVWSGTLPDSRMPAGASSTLNILAENPLSPGEYRILVDMVDEAKCWFHERGSSPLLIDMLVVAASVPEEIERLSVVSFLSKLPVGATVQLDPGSVPPKVVIKVPIP